MQLPSIAAGKRFTLPRPTGSAVSLKARGDDKTAHIDTLRATMPTGRLDGGGQVWWAPTLRWQADVRLAGFDPGYFLPDWRGAVNGRLRSTGDTRSDGGLDARVDASELGGRLRGRALSGRANVLAHLPAREGDLVGAEGEIAVGLGSSRIDAKGRVADTIDIDAKLSPLHGGSIHAENRQDSRSGLRVVVIFPVGSAA